MIPWSRKRQPTPAFLLGELRGQRSLAGYISWGQTRQSHCHSPMVSHFVLAKCPNSLQNPSSASGEVLSAALRGLQGTSASSQAASVHPLSLGPCHMLSQCLKILYPQPPFLPHLLSLLFGLRRNVTSFKSSSLDASYL